MRDDLSGALANGLLQANVEDGLRGRLMAAYSFVVVGLSQVVARSSRGPSRRRWASTGRSAGPQ